MDDSKDAFLFGGMVGAVLGFGIAAIIMLAVGGTYSEGYRTGQIDAANGVMKYELRDNPNRTRVWVKKEGQ